MKPLLTACAVLALAACSQPPPANNTAASEPAAAPAAPVKVDAPAGAYTLDKMHASLTFKVNHLGFSHYTAQFTDFDAKLQFDPANPTASRIDATIKPTSLELPNPPPGFTKELLGPNWLDAGKFPEITFKTTAVELTGPTTARITGDFTLHGVTKPVVLEVKFNGGYAGHPMDPQARIGFSAHGTLKRSDFGIAYGIPAPGTKVGVSDSVQVLIETELNGPPLAAATAPAPKS